MTVSRPFTPDHLTTVVNRGVETRRLRRQARELMEERDQKLLEVANETSKIRAIVNSMADGILVFNRERKLVLWNPTVIKMLNLNDKLETERTITEVIPYENLVKIISRALTRIPRSIRLVGRD
jgi:PAS domain-containing protein